VGCHLTCFTSCVCPCSTATHSKSNPGWHSQIHTVLSRPHVASRDPLGENAHDLTSFSCPSTTATHSQSPPRSVHTAVDASKEAVASMRPDIWGMGKSHGTSIRRFRREDAFFFGGSGFASLETAEGFLSFPSHASGR
jgi:hypothetical protein